MARTPKEPFVRLPFRIVVDNQETMPFRFTGLRERDSEGGRIIVAPLVTDRHIATGDYSIDGMENLITIERKSVADLYGTLGGDRARFEREFERMALMEFSAVVVEGDWSALMYDAPQQSSVPFETIEGTIFSWTHRFPKTHWLLCHDRRHAEHATLRLLMQFHRRYIRSQA